MHSAFQPPRSKLPCKLMTTAEKTSVCEKWQLGYSQVEETQFLWKPENWAKYLSHFLYVNSTQSKHSEFGVEHTAEGFFYSNLSSS